MATIYDPAKLRAIQTLLERAVASVVHETLNSEVEYDDYDSASVACDQAEDNGFDEEKIDALHDLICGCKQLDGLLNGCEISMEDIWSGSRRMIDRHRIEFTFADIPEDLFMMLSKPVLASVLGVTGVSTTSINFNVRPIILYVASP